MSDKEFKVVFAYTIPKDAKETTIIFDRKDGEDTWKQVTLMIDSIERTKEFYVLAIVRACDGEHWPETVRTLHGYEKYNKYGDIRLRIEEIGKTIAVCFFEDEGRYSIAVGEEI